jgi:DNA repair protein RecO (recombination protein O)
VAQEEEASIRLFLLLQRGLRALDRGPIHPDLVTGFLLKASEVVGVAPALDECAGCGRTDELTRFSFAAGGVLCERCRTPGAYVLRDGVTAYLAQIAAGDLGDLPPAEPSFSGEARGVARRFVEFHLERKLESLALFDG